MKRITAMVLCLVLLLSMLPFGTWAEEPLSWTIEKGVLTIQGAGEMDFPQIPWKDRAEEITSVQMAAGITSIQPEAFLNCRNLNTVSMPKELRYIGRDAFRGCARLSWIALPSKLVGIETGAFADCGKLRSVNMPKRLSWIEDGAFDSAVLFSGWKDSAAYDYIQDNGGSFRMTDYYTPTRAASGDFGDIHWSLEKGTMTLTGSGRVEGKTLRDFPWDDLRADIARLVVEEGITAISAPAFAQCRKLKEVRLPASVTEVAEGTFRADAVLSGAGSPAADLTEELAASTTAAEEVTTPEEGKETVEATEVPETLEASEEAQKTSAQEEEEPTEPEATEPEAGEKPEEKEEPGTLCVESVTAQRGQQIKIPIRVSGNPGLCGLNFQIRYDRTVLTLVDFDCTGDILRVADWTVGIGEGEKALWLQPDGTEADGELLTLVFQVAADAPQGTYQVFLEGVLAVNPEGKPLNLTVEPGVVTLTAGIAGDINGDGRVTVSDAQRLRRFLSGQNVTIENTNADLNRDGAVNILDLMLLNKLASGE